MARRKQQESSVIDIQLPAFSQFQVSVVGQTPFVCNRQSEKVKRGLLHPPSASRRKQALKHHPLEEFRASPYMLSADDAPTLLAFLPVAFKRATASAAIDVPGAKKAQIGRLVRFLGERTPLWGVPKLWMATVVEAGMTGAPDVRTRAIIPQWVMDLDVTYPPSLITRESVVNLLAMAGLIIGVGDGRNENGGLSYGDFRVTNPSDPEVVAIKAEGGRAAQVAALEAAEPYDDESEALLAWFTREVLKEVE